MNKLKQFFNSLFPENSELHARVRYSQTDLNLNLSVAKLETELQDAKMQIVALSVSGDLMSEDLNNAKERVEILLLINKALLQEIQNPTPNV